MKTSFTVRFVGLAVSTLAGVAMAQPTDSFHVMQIEQVIGGVNGDVTKQAVQLRMRTGFQNLLSNARLICRDATGSNPILMIDFTTNCPNSLGGDRVLATTAAFNSSTTPATVADFTIVNPIPPSYMAAGRLTFEDDFGTIYWSLAWGGAAYTGSNLGALTNDADGNFGPAFPGPCPTTGTQAIQFQGPFAAPSTTNLADYALTSGAATFTSNLRNAYVVNAGGPPPCYANCDASTTNPVLTANDFQCFLNAFASGTSYANCDASTTNPVLTANDFQCFLNAFAAGCT